MGLFRVTNDLSSAPSNPSGTWQTFKVSAETAAKRFLFIVFIIVITISIIKFVLWIYKYAMRRHLNNEIGKYTALLQAPAPAPAPVAAAPPAYAYAYPPPPYGYGYAPPPPPPGYAPPPLTQGPLQY